LEELCRRQVGFFIRENPAGLILVGLLNTEDTICMLHGSNGGLNSQDPGEENNAVVSLESLYFPKGSHLLWHLDIPLPWHNPAQIIIKCIAIE
jgi:hypothetical protein